MKDEANKFIGTVLEYEAPFDAVKNTAVTTVSTSVESKSGDAKRELSNEKSEKVKSFFKFTFVQWYLY